MSALPSPKTTGLAPVFIKNLSYSKKKDSFSPSKNSFDSNRNMFNFFMLIHFLKDDVESFMGFGESSLENNTINNVSSKTSIIDNDNTPNEESENDTETDTLNNIDTSKTKLDDSDIKIDSIPDLNNSSIPKEGEYTDLTNIKKDITMSLSTELDNQTVLRPKLPLINNLKSNLKAPKKSKPSKKKSK